MKCKQEKERSRYIDGRLAEEELLAFEEHQKECQECAEALDTHQAERLVLQSFPKVEYSEKLTNQIMNSLAQFEQRPQQAHEGWLDSLLLSMRVIAPVSSAIALCLLIWTIGFQPSSAIEPQEQIASVEEFALDERDKQADDLVQFVFSD